MSDSMFGSLLNMLDKHTVGEVANALGQPQTSVARGMESSIAAMLGGIASKSEDTGALQKILDMVPSTSGAISWSQIASSVADPNSSLMATGKRLLPDAIRKRRKSRHEWHQPRIRLTVWSHRHLALHGSAGGDELHQ